MQLAFRRPVLMGLAAVMMWSTVAVGFKLGLRNMEPIQLLWIGSCFSWVLFSICCVVLPSQPRETKHTVRACLLGLLNPLLYYIVLLTAYDLLPAHVAQPLNYTWAIVTALLAIPMLRQKLNRSTLIGILVGYFGVLMLVTKGQLTGSLGFNRWVFGLALASTLDLGNLLDLECVDQAGTMVVHVVWVYRRSPPINRYLLLYGRFSKSDFVEFWVRSMDWIARNGVRVSSLAASYVDYIKRREIKPAHIPVADDFTPTDLHDPRRIDPLHRRNWNLLNFCRLVRGKSSTRHRRDVLILEV